MKEPWAVLAARLLCSRGRARALEKGDIMKTLRYKGPQPYVNVLGYGAHYRGLTKQYPDHVAQDLLETSKRQQWQVVEEKPAEKAPKKEPATEGRKELDLGNKESEAGSKRSKSKKK